ncbi:WYL domain-containing protein [Xanthomonas campestris pv. raphani]|uniref:WYL domain-containing protein n=1 Tax=Xanthomonas campestris TaxID=339 RepID=UPI002B2227DD|nr:WYL domain-containing protein [Xanthomonas campestris]MEA9753343.1 WYL domain-containing protein [Xanthomonas campestris pv. raphani]MEA9813603.1 WYL domain-containing protein [Xanthomonas campestris pv. raphani]
MNQEAEKAKPRWGQNRRLHFIDVRLQYDGRINRADLMSFFDISLPQASADLKLYQDLAPQNLLYDPRQRMYLADPRFEPAFARSEATRYLNELQRLARGIIEPDESFIGFKPETGVVATPARKIGAFEVAILVRAIRDAVALRVRYQSMEEDGPREFDLTPHAMGFDGLRWHVRAWCHSRARFRDFAIGRLTVLAEAQAPKIDAATDGGWNTQVVVLLVPHPGLSGAQRECVMRDYGMKNGKAELTCRKAMLFYTLRHLNLQDLEPGKIPAQQHVVVQNSEEVQRWVDEDREGIAQQK